MKRYPTYLAVCLAVCFAAGGLNANRAVAQNVSFAGKTINLTIGFAAGGGVDLYARTLARHLAEKLPGNPNIVPLNQPGAGGVVALNDWSRRGEKDGTSITVGALSQTDPDSLDSTNAQFKPASFKMIGGLGAYSQGLFIRTDALPRLTDKSAPPVAVGMVGATLRGGTYMILWGASILGWNVKWVPGYKSTGELRQALERGEVEMATFGATQDIDYVTKVGKVTVLAQSGQVQGGKRIKRPVLGDAPIFSDLVQGKPMDPQLRQAFDYWENVSQVGMWLALPPGTPAPVVQTYLKAFEATSADPAFQSDYSKIDPDFLTIGKADVERQLAELAKVTPQTLKFLADEQERRGLGGRN
jgi:tripartite-type tricarboxylate transporter receptor subunit TctC